VEWRKREKEGLFLAAPAGWRIIGLLRDDDDDDDDDDDERMYFNVAYCKS